MRRSAVLILFLLAALPGVGAAYDRQGMATIGGSLGAAGYLGDTPTLSSGPRTRLSVRAHSRYLLNNHVRVSGSIGYTWNSYKGGFNNTTHETEDTLLVVRPVELGLEYSLGPDFRAHRPYVGFQLGLYNWYYLANQSFGVRAVVRDQNASKDVSKTFFGYGLNLGEEYLWRDNASVTVELGYHHINANDNEYFNSAFTSRFIGSLNLTELRAGMNYYFSLGSTRKRTQVGVVGPAATVKADSAKAHTTARPEIQKEQLQIVPDESAPSGPATSTPTPPVPAPPATAAPASAPPAAAPADTTSPAAKPPADLPAATPAAIPAATPPDSSAVAPPAAAPAPPDTTGAKK